MVGSIAGGYGSDRRCFAIVLEQNRDILVQMNVAKKE